MNQRNVMLVGILGISILFVGTAFSADVKKSAAPTTPVIRAVIGIVDDTKLAAVRNDYPALASQVLPQIATAKNLKIVIRKTGVMWISPVTQTLDITDLVLARLKTLAPSRTSTARRNSTVSTDAQLSESQRASANQALKALRKLETATEVGLNRASYGERLIDTKTDVQENLRALPEGELRKEIGLAMEAYADARTAWDRTLETESLVLFLKQNRPLVNKYSIRLKALTYEEVIGDYNRTMILTPIWQAASNHLVKAEEILK